jgi:hypothetical protein
VVFLQALIYIYISLRVLFLIRKLPICEMRVQSIFLWRKGRRDAGDLRTQASRGERGNMREYR